MQLQKNARTKQIRAVGVTDAGQDMTDALSTQALAVTSHMGDCCGFVVQQNSPSCGLRGVSVYDEDDRTRQVGTGSGIFTDRLVFEQPHVPIIEEEKLGSSLVREDFTERVIVLFQWRRMLAAGLSSARLIGFHGEHRHLIPASDNGIGRSLDELLATADEGDLKVRADAYLSMLMTYLGARVE